jgi:hypothetical protein
VFPRLFAGSMHNNFCNLHAHSQNCQSHGCDYTIGVLVSDVCFVFNCMRVDAYCIPTCGFSGSTCLETTAVQLASYI